jgi:hypothetical protein
VQRDGVRLRERRDAELRVLEDLGHQVVVEVPAGRAWSVESFHRDIAGAPVVTLTGHDAGGGAYDLVTVRGPAAAAIGGAA